LELTTWGAMPIYLYWGEDEFLLTQAVQQLITRSVDVAWASFNYHRVSGDRSESIINALQQAVTPPFGAGDRLTWLVDTTICQQCPPDLLAELERTLPLIGANSILLLTCKSKPDAKLKSTKLLEKFAQIQEFTPIPPWKTDLIVARVQQAAQGYGVRLDTQAMEFIAQAVGNDSRLLDNELQKLTLAEQPLKLSTLKALVSSNTSTSLQLAGACLAGNAPQALQLLADLLGNNEPPLRIVATVTGQFRTWLLVKLAIASGLTQDIAIAQAAEIGNPKRVYFLKQETSRVSSQQLLDVLPVLLELEANLKKGYEPTALLQQSFTHLCQICR